MKRFYLLLLCLAFAACGQKQPRTMGPFQTTLNHSIDVTGKPDKRPTSWGLSQAVPIRLKVTAPTGFRVRILRVAGDLVAWPKAGTMTGAQYAEVGWGLNTSLNDGSKYIFLPGTIRRPSLLIILARGCRTRSGNPWLVACFLRPRHLGVWASEGRYVHLPDICGAQHIWSCDPS